MSDCLSFDSLWKSWQWEPISNCPGRYKLLTDDRYLPIANLVDETTAVTCFRIPTARDKVLVAQLRGGGIISYSRKNGTFLHTLNTAEGFNRKLDQIGIRIAD